MVNLIETVTREFANFKTIELCCKNCGQAYANFSDVKSLNRIFWEINENFMSWDAKYTIVKNDVYCQCCEQLGMKLENGVLVMYKKFCKLFH